jgi:autotransporter-associated beta strand protein
MGPKHFACLAILGILSSRTSPATTRTWNGGDGTGSDFGAATNWVGGLAPANDLTADTARFDALTGGQPVVTAARSVAGIDFASANGGWTLSGVGPLTLGTGGLGASGQTNGVNSVSVASIALGAGSTWNLFSASVVASNATTVNLSSTLQLNASGQLVLRLQRPSAGSGVGTLNLTGPITGTSSGGVKLSGSTYSRNTISISGGGSRSTYNGDTVISQATVNFDVLANASSSSGFGSSGSVFLGDNASFALVNYLGAGGATDRPWLLAGSGGGCINNNGSGPIAFNSQTNVVTGSGNRRLQLGGSNSGANRFGQPIGDAPSGATRVNKNDGGTWVLANPTNSYTGPTTLSGGTLEISKLNLGGKSSSLGSSANVATNLVFSGATLNYTGAGDNTDRLFQMAAGATIKNNGSGPLDFAGTGAVLQSGNTLRTLTLGGSYAGANTFAPCLGDNPAGGTVTALTKSGTTTWVLTGSHSYSGTTLVTGGTLLVNGSLAAGSAVVVQAEATLGGVGTLGGPVTVQAEGTLRPGTGGPNTETLSLSNSLALADGSQTLMVVNRTNTQTASTLAGLTTLTYGGTLTVTNVGPPLQAGDPFRLFGARNYYGWFSALALPPLAAGLSWDTTQLAVDGTLRVVLSPPVTVTPASTIAVCGETVVFTASLTNSASVAYQWFDNHGTAIPNAINPSLTLSNVQPTQSGSWAVVANTLSGQATNAATLTVMAPALSGLYPQGDAFSFTFYSTLDADSVYSLANGATALGPYYGDQSAPLSNAVSLNTKFLYKVALPSMAGLGPTDFDDPNFVWPSDQTISNETLAIIQGVRSNLNIGMWDVEPEELRCWKPKELHFLALVSSLIHSNDPYHRPLYMYEPNNRTASQLAQTVVYQDLCGKGMYVNMEDTNYETSRIWARWSMEQELGAIARGNTSAVPAIVTWMAADPPPGDYGLITNWCRHDLYMGLVMGGKAIRIWSGYRGRTGFSDANFQAYFNGYLTVARELNGPLCLAPVFLHGQPQSNVNMTVTSGPATLSTVFNGTTNVYPPITYLGTTFGGTNYLFIVNSSAQPVTACFSGLPATTRTNLFIGGTAVTPGGTFTLTVPGLTVEAFQFANTAPPPPPLLSLQLGSGTNGNPVLVLSWPPGYSDYTLQGQTNPLGVGLSPNWAAIPGVVSNRLSLPLMLTNGSVFFRLIRTP